MKRQRRGMTLIEVVVVITILSVLTAAVAVAVVPWLSKSKQRVAELDLRTVRQALDTYFAQFGHYPDPGRGLQALVESQVMESLPVDPWNREYLYTLEAGKPVVVSYGEDGLPGGEGVDADLSSKNVARVARR